MGSEPTVMEGPKRRVSPPALVAIVVGAVVLLGLFYFFVVAPLFSTEDDETAASPRVRTGAIAQSPSPSPSPSEPPIETFEVFEAKDPFRPLVVPGGAPPASITGSTPSPGSTGGGAAGGAAPTGGQRVQLLDVFTDAGATKAQIKVASTVFTVLPGDVFANNFKLVSISGDCATLLHGDDKFTLCEGEEVFK